ncbi:hypothetical protein D3C73_1112890 [compost metagenome]
MLELAFAEPDHQPGANHCRARQAENEVQPTHQRTGEMAHVQTKESAGNRSGQRGLRGRAKQLPAYALESHRAAKVMNHPVRAVSGEHHRGIRIPRIVHREARYPAIAPLLASLFQ